jgi:hypothetical protein
VYQLSLEHLHQLPYQWMAAAPPHQVVNALAYLSVRSEELQADLAAAADRPPPRITQAEAAIAALEQRAASRKVA